MVLRRQLRYLGLEKGFEFASEKCLSAAYLIDKNGFWFFWRGAPSAWPVQTRNLTIKCVFDFFDSEEETLYVLTIVFGICPDASTLVPLPSPRAGRVHGNEAYLLVLAVVMKFL